LLINLRSGVLERDLALAGSSLVFVGVFLGFTLGIAPLVWRQFEGLIREAPAMMGAVQQQVEELIAKYPIVIEQAPITEMLSSMQGQAASLGQAIVGFGLSSIPGVFTFAIYMVLIPLMVFFFLKDRDELIAWVLSFLPKERPALDQIGRDMNRQIANYVRGKGIEIIIIGTASYIAFISFGLNYTALLALLVGLSVIVPYIGAFLVTIPVVLVAFFQFGLSGDFYWIVGALLFYSGARWKRTCTAALFRGSELASSGDCYRRVDIWRRVGCVGCLFCHPVGHALQCVVGLVAADRGLARNCV
jgi:putative permease